VLIAVLVCAYLLGAIPVGYVVAKAKGIDILTYGSGNIGATNVHRALGKGAGLLVFALDMAKGLVPALIAMRLFHDQAYSFAAGIAAVAGHCLSPFLRFKGGKGIATGLGAMLGSCPLVALTAFAVFLLVLLPWRYISAASLVATLTIIPSGIYFGVPRVLLYAFGATTLFVFYRHRANIKRLLNGTESRFSLKSKHSSDATAAANTVVGSLLLLGLFAATSPHLQQW
jgi:glycerol-3-phosphate acyltransferase PlsY